MNRKLLAFLVTAICFATVALAALPVSDTFTTGTDQSLSAYSASWTLEGTSDIQVSQSLDLVYSNRSGSNYSTGRWNADTFSANQYSQLNVNIVGTQAFVNGGPAARIQAGAESGYVCAVGGDGTNADRLRIMKVTAGVGTLLGSNVIHGVAYPSDVKLEAIGTTLNCYMGGVLKSTTTDATYATGYAGIMVANQSTNWRGDNFSADNIAAGGSAVPVFMYHYSSMKH